MKGVWVFLVFFSTAVFGTCTWSSGTPQVASVQNGGIILTVNTQRGDTIVLTCATATGVIPGTVSGMTRIVNRNQRFSIFLAQTTDVTFSASFFVSQPTTCVMQSFTGLRFAMAGQDVATLTPPALSWSGVALVVASRLIATGTASAPVTFPSGTANQFSTDLVGATRIVATATFDSYTSGSFTPFGFNGGSGFTDYTATLVFDANCV